MYSDIGRSGIRRVTLIASGVRRSSILDEQDATTSLPSFRLHAHTTPCAGIADYLEQRSGYGIEQNNRFTADAKERKENKRRSGVDKTLVQFNLIPAGIKELC